MPSFELPEAAYYALKDGLLPDNRPPFEKHIVTDNGSIPHIWFTDAKLRDNNNQSCTRTTDITTNFAGDITYRNRNLRIMLKLREHGISFLMA